VNENFEDTLGEALGIIAFSYNDTVTQEVWDVLTTISEATIPPCSEDIAKSLDLSPTHVELIQYLICNNDNAEYGVSPRCCWLTEKGQKLVKELRNLV